MNIYFKIALISIILDTSLFQSVSGQSQKIVLNDSIEVQQKDIIDVYHKLFENQPRKNTGELKGNRSSISVIPAIGYSMHTGITGVVAISTVLSADYERKRNSRVIINGNYSQYHQYWFTSIGNIFLEKQKLHLFGDVRYYNFPTQTYGLGTRSALSNPLQIDYSYLRFYQVVFRELSANFFVGMGYSLDYHWNIKVDSVRGVELDQFIKYQKGTSSRSSGLTLNILYDSRKNAINPRNGTYVNVQFRPNLTLLGSDKKWQSFLLDIRHYIRIPASSRNILALWSYNDITISGTPPYLDMPSIGWDDYSCTGRGYSPGRYTGRNLIYFESEYRFSLTKNGLLGGVIFGNAESVSESIPEKRRTIVPAGGLGLRIRINKHSDTNLAVDYGFGIRGSHGFFFTLGEVF
jgi:outer membrane protein assembly factor BamA